MNQVWAKMMTALRGGMNEAGEAVVDSQALRILDQEVRDASEELKQSKEALVAIIAQQKVAEEKAESLKKQIQEYEGYAVKALEQSNEALALEVAEKIANFEGAQQSEEATAAGHKTSADQLRQSIKQAEANIKRLKQQVDTVKATESVQRAQEAVATRYAGSDSKLRTAMESLERIKEKQAHNAAKMAASQELAAEEPDQDLEAKLKEAGIVGDEHNAEKILARLKSKVKG